MQDEGRTNTTPDEASVEAQAEIPVKASVGREVERAYTAESNEYAYTQESHTPQKPSLLLSPRFCAPILMLLVGALVLICGGVSFSGSGVDMYLSFVSVQLIAFVLPCVFYVRYRSLDIRERVRVRLPAPDKIMFIVLCSLILVVLSMTMSAVGGVFGNVYEDRYSHIEYTEQGVAEAIYYAVCFAVIPAVCEELTFRGIIMSELQSTSVGGAVIVSSLFFAMVHFDPATLPFCFLSGLVLSMCAYAADSIIASFFAHMLYNLFALFGGEIVSRVTRSIDSPELIAIVLGALLLFFFILAFGECHRIYYSYARKNKDSAYAPKYKNSSAAVRFASVLLSPGVILVSVLYVIAALIKYNT